MKGERTLVEEPFRYGGILHQFDKDVEYWNGVIEPRCWCCGGNMTKNLYSKSGTLLKRIYPYVAVFKITKGKHKGMVRFRVLCRACAYNYGVGVVEMDGNKYMKKDDFNEEKYKKRMVSNVRRPDK